MESSKWREEKGSVDWQGRKEGKGEELEDTMREERWGISSLPFSPWFYAEFWLDIFLGRSLSQLSKTPTTLFPFPFQFPTLLSHGVLNMLSRSTKLVTPLYFLINVSLVERFEFCFLTEFPLMFPSYDRLMKILQERCLLIESTKTDLRMAFFPC